MATPYVQQTPKRQKIREVAKASNFGESFSGIGKVDYQNDTNQYDTLSYRFYNANERIHGRSMEEWLKLSISLTAFKNNGSDYYGRPTFQRAWDDHSNSVENYKRCIKAFFEFCIKLGVKYWTAFDSDLFPHNDNLEEYFTNCEEITDFLHENIQKTHIRPLWIAPDLHSSPKFVSGAGTSHDAFVFTQAAFQVKRALDTSHRLNAECFLIWSGREYYNGIYNTDVQREMKHYGRLIKMAIDYRDRLAYRNQLLFLPKPRFKNKCASNNQNNSYIWDVTSASYFLKQHNLDRQFKISVEPGHEHYIAAAYNILGSVYIDNETGLDIRKSTLLMKAFINQGAVPPGGINLSVIPQRDSTDIKDMFTTVINVIDRLALGLRNASHIISDDILTKHLQQRYTSFYSGFGLRLSNGEVTMEECEDQIKKQHLQMTNVMPSSRCEHWEKIFSTYIEGNRDIV